MPDPYRTITTESEESLAECARVLELRGREEGQVRLREKVLQEVRGRVLEVMIACNNVVLYTSIYTPR